MSFPNQTTLAQQFVNFVCMGMPARSLQQLHRMYLVNRGVVLGLATPAPGAPGGPGGQMPSRRQFAGLNLRARLAALGTAFGPLMTENGIVKSYIEAAVNRQITALGGVAVIDPTGEWGWIVAKDSSGNYLWINSTPTPPFYQLPGNPFNITIQAGTPPTPLIFTVTLGVDGSGNGTVAFSTASGAYTGPDPM